MCDEDGDDVKDGGRNHVLKAGWTWVLWMSVAWLVLAVGGEMKGKGIGVL